MKMMYLVVKNLNGAIDSNFVPLINARGNAGKEIKEGETWGDLKYGFQMRVGEAGRGELIIRHKNSVEHWILPFEDHPALEQPSNPNDAWVSTRDEYLSYGWDVIEEEI